MERCVGIHKEVCCFHHYRSQGFQVLVSVSVERALVFTFVPGLGVPNSDKFFDGLTCIVGGDGPGVYAICCDDEILLAPRCGPRHQSWWWRRRANISFRR
ncbi:hypothetical protein Syun_020941 [Stephania yunnanensis]|uniref:Uncharacterized protein n=1 Tax=Stephania yunnanensis TaxID=152371 RepID=A0AAP0NQ69_9MAGN